MEKATRNKAARFKRLADSAARLATDEQVPAGKRIAACKMLQALDEQMSAAT